jgi:hypothetical protein
MNIKSIALFTVLVTLAMPAFAYIDPGSGSAIMSGIIGFFVAAWLVIKTYWYKIKSLFSKKSSETQPTEAEQSPDKAE